MEVAKILLSLSAMIILGWSFFTIGKKSAISAHRSIVAEAMRILRVEYCSDEYDPKSFSVITNEYFSEKPSFKGLITINPEVFDLTPSSIDKETPIAWGLLTQEEILVLYGDNNLVIEIPDR